MKFDPETLRIEDLEEDEEDFDTLQTKTLVADYKEVAAIRTEDKDDTVSRIDQTKLQGLAIETYPRKSDFLINMLKAGTRYVIK